ncbi:sialidase family protein [Acinetobacter pittii]|uniref:sialidase family protein n=1 Tax=Acinetobacter pittii TaxID=48296 RepID=UPI003261C3CB
MAVPNKDALIGPTVTEAQFKTNLGAIVDFIKPIESQSPNYATTALLTATRPVENQSYAKALDTGKVWFWNKPAGAAEGNYWTSTDLSELDQAKKYADNLIQVDPAKPLHRFSDANGEVIMQILDDGTLEVIDLRVNGIDFDPNSIASISETIKTDEVEILHRFSDASGLPALTIDSRGRPIGGKPFDLGIDAMFANATTAEELNRIGLYHDYVKSLGSTPYNFNITVATKGSGEKWLRMPGMVQISKNRIFVAYTIYRDESTADQTHAEMHGKFINFDLVNKTASIDGDTVVFPVMAVEKAHRHPCFAKVLNKQTGKYRYICLFNTGTQLLGDSELNLVYSDDDCKTWSPIQTLMTESTTTEPFYLIPSSVVTIQRGIFAGRLVTGVFRQTPNQATSEVAILYSDDAGENWKIGGKLVSGAFDTPDVTYGFLNETMICLDAQGNLFLGIRNEGYNNLNQRVMLWARSYDGGNTLVIEDKPHLVTAMSQGSILQAANSLQEGIPKILYSYPSQPNLGATGYQRRYLRVALSYDNGKSFPIEYTPDVLSTWTGYSHLIGLTDQDFVLVQERGPNAETIYINFFNIAEMLSHV